MTKLKELFSKAISSQNVLTNEIIEDSYKVMVDQTNEYKTFLFSLTAIKEQKIYQVKFWELILALHELPESKEKENCLNIVFDYLDKKLLQLA